MKRWVSVGIVLGLAGVLAVSMAQQRTVAGKNPGGNGQLNCVAQQLPAIDQDALFPPPPPEPPRPPCCVIQVLDADHDRVLSAEEIQNAPAALLMLDRDGDGSLTPEEFCPLPPLVACCLPGGTCEMLPLPVCHQRHGRPLPPGTTCDTADCNSIPPPPPPPAVACCLPDGTCQMLAPHECVNNHGRPMGPGSTCETVDCQAPPPPPPPPPPVACCFADGTCQDLPPRECFRAGGRPLGPDTNCASAVCTQ